MSVGSQVTDAARKLADGRYVDAIISVSVALSATARLEEPVQGDRDACRSFIDRNLAIISRIGWVSFGVRQPINFRYRRLDRRYPGIATRTMSDMLYDVVRCTAIHEAKLPDNLQFIAQPMIQLGLDGELLLPVDVIFGLLMAIVASPQNAGQFCEGSPLFRFGGAARPVNSFWGDDVQQAVRAEHVMAAVDLIDAVD